MNPNNILKYMNLLLISNNNKNLCSIINNNNIEGFRSIHTYFFNLIKSKQADNLNCNLFT